MSATSIASAPAADLAPRRNHRALLGAAIAGVAVLLLLFVSLRQAALFLVGVGLGVALAHFRFGFTTGWRQLVTDRDPRGVTGQLVLLALAALLAMPLLGRFGELQPALGPPSVALLLGAFVFGMTMQIADGCGSGTLYKAGLGVPLNLGILPLFAFGSFLGSLHLEHWLALGSAEPVGLVAAFGVTPALGLTLAALVVTAAAVRWWVGPQRRWFERRWLLGAAALALLATLNLLLAGQPWGVVYGFGLWAAKIAHATALWDPAGSAFWSQSGHALRLSQSLLMDITSITNIGILAGALWVSSRTGEVSQPLTGRQWATGLAAGLLMGYSARLAFGCNVGAMLSGISTGSLHGWIWVAFAFAGTLWGIRLRRRFGFDR